MTTTALDDLPLAPKAPGYDSAPEHRMSTVTLFECLDPPATLGTAVGAR